jgi:hypothetical protein
MQTAVPVIELVQMLNQQIAPLLENVGRHAQQLLDLLQRSLVGLSTFELPPLANVKGHLFSTCQSHEVGRFGFFDCHAVWILEGVSGFQGS